MGFYFASERTRALTEDYTPAITPGEYTSELSGAMEALADASAHRLAGVTCLHQGDLAIAVKHLEIALGFVRRKVAAPMGLAETLRLQCEAALLRLVLVRLHMKLGQVRAARRLVREGQEVL